MASKETVYSRILRTSIIKNFYHQDKDFDLDGRDDPQYPQVMMSERQLVRVAIDSFKEAIRLYFDPVVRIVA